MLTVEDIQKAVCQHFSVSLEDLKFHRKYRSIVLPRQVAMFLCRRRLNLSYEELGERFGGRDHTTVMSAVKRIGGYLDGNARPNLAASIQIIEDNLDRPSEPEPEKGQTIMRVRVDGVLEYAVGLSKAEAIYLKRFLWNNSSGSSLSTGIIKKCRWVIETAERDERWARERAAGEVPNV